MPRPFHPKRDFAAQNAFKKTFPDAVRKARRPLPSAITLAHHAPDEARFSRMNRIRPCWHQSHAARGRRAVHSRIYLSLRAVAPKDGTCVYLIMPTSNTACFQVFLYVLARKFARQYILLVLYVRPATDRRPCRSRQRHALVSHAVFA